MGCLAIKLNNAKINPSQLSSTSKRTFILVLRTVDIIPILPLLKKPKERI